MKIVIFHKLAWMSESGVFGYGDYISVINFVKYLGLPTGKLKLKLRNGDIGVHINHIMLAFY